MSNWDTRVNVLGEGWERPLIQPGFAAYDTYAKLHFPEEAEKALWSILPPGYSIAVLDVVRVLFVREPVYLLVFFSIQEFLVDFLIWRSIQDDQPHFYGELAYEGQEDPRPADTVDDVRRELALVAKLLGRFQNGLLLGDDKAWETLQETVLQDAKKYTKQFTLRHD